MCVIVEITVLLMPNKVLAMYLYVHLGCVMDVGKTAMGATDKTAMSMTLKLPKKHLMRDEVRLVKVLIWSLSEPKLRFHR